MSSELDAETNAEALAAITDLLESEGWKLLTRRAADEWGFVGYGRQMQAALRSIPPGPDRAFEIAQAAERVEATKRAIDDIMNWPYQERQRLTPKATSKRPFAALRRTS